MWETKLTDSENELVDFITRGFTTPEIAQRLDQTEHEVLDRTSQLLQKLHLTSRLELLFWACCHRNTVRTNMEKDDDSGAA